MTPSGKSRRSVLLTGASGLVGQALLKRLDGWDFYCLTHRTPLQSATAVALVSGDIQAPRLGLDADTYRDLAGKVDCVVHAAAITSFGESEDAIFATNVEGTRRVVEFAAAASLPLYHLSTAFVALCDPSVSDARPNAYARSKAEAEEVVRESGLKAVILRPSRIVGDSRTGAISRFQGFHLLFDLQVRGEMPYTCTSLGALVDFVPQDVVANVLTELVKQGITEGEYWLTAGERALTLERTIDLSREHILRLTGREVQKPEVIDRTEFEAVLRPALMEATPSELIPMVEGVLQMMDSLNLKPFPNSLPRLEQLLGISTMTDPETTLVRNLQYWARRRGLIKAASFAVDAP